MEKMFEYLPAGNEPLSADVIAVRGKEYTWFFDVGASDEALRYIESFPGKKAVVISHFHEDHMGNLKRFTPDILYVSKESRKHTRFPEGAAPDLIEVEKPIGIEDGMKLTVFPLPSSHAKGCLGLMINETFIASGDGTYATMKDGHTVYNAGQVQALIKVLRELPAERMLLSHRRLIETPKDAVLRQLELFYQLRKKNEPYIVIS